MAKHFLTVQNIDYFGISRCLVIHFAAVLA
jgi:hypothetical protein